ncbi:unc93a [Symbiodinium microadriaticum]|nr:unc93a [Symbiodinium microadriaticum]CAE7947632.1 unc93a [Symbiodinium sp. KB8]
MTARDETFYRRAVKLLSFGFFGVFGGFQAAQGLQSSLNAELGELNLACLYGTFTVLCLVVPPVLSHLERWLGMQWLLALCSAAYAAMALSNVIKVPATPSPMWAVTVSFNVLVGVAAPLLWTSQNTYLSRCALHAAALSQEAAGIVTTRYNSLFFSIYQFAGMFGNILASVILVAFGTIPMAKDILFFALTLCCLMGASVFLAMPTVVHDLGDEEKLPRIADTGRLAFTDAKISLMIPFMITNGMCLAFFLGDFQTDVTCPVAGPAYTGFVIAAFYGVNALSSAAWGFLITRKWLSRRTVFILATVFVASFLLMKQLWTVPQNFHLIPGSTTWQKAATPDWKAILAVFAMASAFACGDSFCEAGPAMTLQTFYASSDLMADVESSETGTFEVQTDMAAAAFGCSQAYHAVEFDSTRPACSSKAMANYKLWQSLGFAAGFFIAIPLKEFPAVRGAILVSLSVLSLLSVLLLDRYISPVDGLRDTEPCQVLNG